MTPYARMPRDLPHRTDKGPAPRWRRAEREADKTAKAALHTTSPLGHTPTGEVPLSDGPHHHPGVGRPLDDDRRLFFERRLGADLSRVRVHDDAAAAHAADEEQAHGYTVGDHVVLAADADHDVLAHELVHVLQQRRAGRTALQRQERQPTETKHLGPPTTPFDIVRTRPTAEHARVLFQHDSLSLSGLDLKALQVALEGNRPLQADIDGYASREGAADHNLNLSAHRAAVVAAALTPLLPEGSVVRLHAHGATEEFGADSAANRRAGIRLTELPEPAAPPSAPPLGTRPRLVPHLELKPPAGLPLPPGTLPPVPDVQLRPPHLPGREAPRDPLPDLKTPAPGPSVLKPDAPAPPPQPFSPTRPIVDWPALRQVFTEHGAGSIDARTGAAAESFALRWYQFYRSKGVPEEQARWLANLGTRKVVADGLSREGNTVKDRSDEELRRQGLPTPVEGGVDLLEILRWLKKERR
ncbi:DUF4157 domain-containing protein [Streptomyces triculaminicus]|uniref:DUF4157 domain-containing protein n=1 Tax=Streptomyces triculaminicus TaxID=2816232 RepID=UPI00378BA298